MLPQYAAGAGLPVSVLKSISNMLIWIWLNLPACCASLRLYARTKFTILRHKASWGVHSSNRSIPQTLTRLASPGFLKQFAPSTPESDSIRLRRQRCLAARYTLRKPKRLLFFHAIPMGSQNYMRIGLPLITETPMASTHPPGFCIIMNRHCADVSS